MHLILFVESLHLHLSTGTPWHVCLASVPEAERETYGNKWIGYWRNLDDFSWTLPDGDSIIVDETDDQDFAAVKDFVKNLMSEKGPDSPKYELVKEEHQKLLEKLKFERK